MTNVNYIQDTMRALVNIKCSYIIVCSKQILRDFKDWKIITQQQFDDDITLGLFKKVNNLLFTYCAIVIIIFILRL